MAKLPKITKNRVLPLKTVEGMYVRDLPMKKMRALLDIGEDQSEEAQVKVMVTIFRELLCDSTGDSYDEFQTDDAEEIFDHVSINMCMSIMEEAVEMLLPSKADAGK